MQFARRILTRLLIERKEPFVTGLSSVAALGVVLYVIATTLRLIVDLKFGFDGVPSWVNIWFCSSIFGLLLLCFIARVLYGEELEGITYFWLNSMAVSLVSLVAVTLVTFLCYRVYYFQGSMIAINACLWVGVACLMVASVTVSGIMTLATLADLSR